MRPINKNLALCRTFNWWYKIRIKWLIISIVLLPVCFQAYAAADTTVQQKLKIGIYQNPPKLFMDEHHQPGGIFPGLIADIARKEGWRIQFIPLSFKEGLKGLENGRIDIMQDVAWSEKRARLYGFTTETVMVSWGRVFQKKGAGINTLIDLKNKRIAVMDGGIYSDGPDGLKTLMTKFELKAQFIPATDYKEVFLFIDKGKADAGVVNRLFGKKNKDRYGVEATPILISPISIRLAFSRAHPLMPQLIETIDRHLKKMKKEENSIYYQLIDEYIRGPKQPLPGWIKRLVAGLIIFIVLLGTLWLFTRRQAIMKGNQLRKKSKDLLDSEKKFQNIFENLQDVYFDITLPGTFETLSPSARKIMGFPMDEMVGMPCGKVYSDVQDQDRLIRTLHNKGKVRDFELKWKKKDQSLYWISLNADLYRDLNGKPKGFKGMLRDITLQKKAVEEISQREERFREMARLLPCGIIELDKDFNISYANQTGLDMSGYSQQDLENGINALDILDSKDRTKAVERAEKFSSSAILEGAQTEYRLLKKNGEILPVLWTSKPIHRKGKTIGFRVSISDLSEIKQLQQEILKIQKLESTGILAGGIAHDFNNILLGLFGNIALAKSELASSSNAFMLLNEAEKSMTRATDLTSQLLTFAQGGEPIKSAVTIDQVIRETADFNLSGSNIKIIMEQPEQLWPVNADPGQISQVISNLVVNARQAMADGGTLTIKMENTVLSEKTSIDPELDRHVKISIRDEGSGIHQDHLEKIFDPYFTTKQDGSGLGLAIVHSIVLKHNGSIHVNSVPGEGSEFVIYLPAADEMTKADAIADHATECALNTKPLNILLMDDDQLVLDVTCRMLNKLGHTFDCCYDGDTALELYRKAYQSDFPYDLVIMDLTIPGGMGGQKAIKQMLEIDPETKAIVASGYSNDPILANYEQYGFKAVITKPYSVDKMNQVIYSALNT